MKKILIVMITVVIVLGVIACAASNSDKNSLTTADHATDPVQDSPASQTEEATIEETPTTTPKLTEPPYPDGWYIDPQGYIPTDLEILVHDNGKGEHGLSWCLVVKDDTVFLQGWSRHGLEYEYVVPEEMLLGYELYVMFTFEGELIAENRTDENHIDACIFYYNDCKGHEFCFNVTSHLLNGSDLYLATVDGLAIRYVWGEDHYWSYYYGGYVKINVNAVFVVDGKAQSGMPPFEKVYLP